MGVRFAQLHFRVLLQVAICVVPAMTLVSFGALYAGSRWLFGWALLFMAYQFMARKQIEANALVVALVPAMMLMRGAFYYSAPIAISVVVLLVQLTLSPEALINFRRNKKFRFVVSREISE